MSFDFEGRWTRAATVMRAHDIDAMFVMKPTNLAYLTGDGRPDVAVVNNRDGQLVWFENRDKPAEGPWKRLVISTQCPRVYDVALADFNGDGRLDAATSGYASGLTLWFKNPGPDGWDKEWPRVVIDDKMSEGRTIRAADFNADGKPDLLAASVGAENVPLSQTDPRHHASSIVWFENPGPPATQSWPKRIIDNAARAPIQGEPADMDGDGDLDVVMAHGMRPPLAPVENHGIAWYEQEGKPVGKTPRAGDSLTWKPHKIGSLPHAFEAVSADLDGDGDQDVAATAWALGDTLGWFENTGDPSAAWNPHVLKEKWYAANQVIIADLDGDGRPDIAGTADDGSSRVKGANELRWWRNTGPRK